LIACLLVLSAAFLLRVDRDGQVRLPIGEITSPDTCFFRFVTGNGCPGCGLTRCFVSIAHGNLRSAWAFNPAGLLFFPFVVAQIPYHAAQIWRIRRNLPIWRPTRLSTCLVFVLVATLIVQWVCRWPF
jgi:hypothetical protein